MKDLHTRLDETLSHIRRHSAARPRFGIILGTGLAGLAREIKLETSIDYAELPHFARPTVESHSGRLLFGTLSGVPVVAMQGRFHYYEGWTLDQISYPVRVMHALGAAGLLVSNAAGCLNPAWKKGDLMLIADHINLMGANPLVGAPPEAGPRFPDMSAPYCRSWRAEARRIADGLGITLREGVYAAMTGPSLETRAEYRMLQIIGADAIGMSTVPEVIVARQLELPVLGVSILTDECFPDSLQPAVVADIIATAAAAEPDLTRLLKAWIAGQASTAAGTA